MSGKLFRHQAKKHPKTENPLIQPLLRLSRRRHCLSGRCHCLSGWRHCLSGQDCKISSKAEIPKLDLSVAIFMLMTLGLISLVNWVRYLPENFLPIYLTFYRLIKCCFFCAPVSCKKVHRPSHNLFVVGQNFEFVLVLYNPQQVCF